MLNLSSKKRRKFFKNRSRFRAMTGRRTPPGFRSILTEPDSCCSPGVTCHREMIQHEPRLSRLMFRRRSARTQNTHQKRKKKKKPCFSTSTSSPPNLLFFSFSLAPFFLLLPLTQITMSLRLCHHATHTPSPPPPFRPPSPCRLVTDGLIGFNKAHLHVSLLDFL